MTAKNNFSALENQAKVSAQKLIAESFQRYEHLDKISQFKKRFKSQEEATEAQLKLAIQSQLDGVKDGLEKLDNSYNECCKIREKIDEISHDLVNIKRLSDGLESLQDQCRYQKQLATAMDNMDYLVKVPEMIRQANILIESENYLNAHKIIEELEGTRDEIMWELSKEACSKEDLDVIEIYFRDVDKLNEKMVQHIQFMGERVINACISQNVVLVSCIRIIDREERADEIWIKRKYQNDFMPPGRPKDWRSEFFKKIRLYVHQKIFESALDEEIEKNFLTRHLEAIRCHTINDLKVIKNIAVIYFPTGYRIFEKFVKIYHEVICDYVQNKANRILDEVESFQLLGWINHYHSEEFMSSKELGINFNNISVEDVNLLTMAQFNKVAHQYLERQRIKLQQWFGNCIMTDAKDWESDQSPQCDGSLKYITSLSTNVLQPLVEMIGKDKVLYHLGESIREKYFPLFLEEITGFQMIYTKELTSYKDRYTKTVIPMSLEYLIANCNNCIKLKAELEEIIKKDLNNSPSILLEIDERLQNIGKEMLNIAQLCLNFIKDMIYSDLHNVIDKVMTPDWAFGNFNAADYILGTIADYNGTLIYLKEAAYRRLIIATVEQITVGYLKNLLTRRLNLDKDSRKQVGNKIFNEGDKLLEYFTKQMNLDKKITTGVTVLPLISQLLLNSDTSMIRLDINVLVKCFPGIRKDQLVNLLLLRGDISLNDAKEIAADYSYCSLNDETNIFQKVAIAVDRN